MFDVRRLTEPFVRSTRARPTRCRRPCVPSDLAASEERVHLAHTCMRQLAGTRTGPARRTSQRWCVIWVGAHCGMLENELGRVCIARDTDKLGLRSASAGAWNPRPASSAASAPWSRARRTCRPTDNKKPPAPTATVRGASAGERAEASARSTSSSSDGSQSRQKCPLQRSRRATRGRGVHHRAGRKCGTVHAHAFDQPVVRDLAHALSEEAFRTPSQERIWWGGIHDVCRQSRAAGSHRARETAPMPDVG